MSGSSVSAALLSVVVLFVAGCGNENGLDVSAGGTSTNVARTEGEITATVRGGFSKWYVTHQFGAGDNSSASEWRDRTANSISVTVVGHKTPTTTVVAGAGEIVLDFVIPDTNHDPVVAEVRIEYFPMGLANPYSSDAGGKAGIVLQKVERKNDLLELEGTFSGTLPYRSRTGNKAPGGITEFTVDNGVFSATIHKQ